jgi:CubicO group peptidase (beta-lactamase class C family)
MAIVGVLRRLRLTVQPTLRSGEVAPADVDWAPMRRILAVLLAAVAAACAAPRQATTDAKVDQLFIAWNKSDSPGCGVGVARDGRVIFERGYGMAHLERRAPITASTAFPLASITKAFTAMSVLIAAERGVLSLDDDVAKYVPAWSVPEPRVTIRHLITHTSGVRDAYTLLGWTPDNGRSLRDPIVDILSRQRGLNFTPGTEYQYNNGGYNLLGRILERASGQSLAAFARTSIFTSLGMTSAHFGGELAPTTDRASGYSPQEQRWRLVPDATDYAGNAGMIASVRDLLTWANNFADARAGSPSIFAMMHTPTVLTNGQPTQSGMGVGIGTYRGKRALRTSGGDVGTATEVLIFPDQKAAVAVLCNMDSVVMGGWATVNPDTLVNGVADVFLADLLEPEAPGAAGATVSAPTPVTVAESDLAGKTGTYRVPTSENHIVLIAVRDGRLALRDFYGDDYDMLLTPLSPNRFELPGIVTLEFAPAEAGRPRAWHVVDSAGQRLIALPLVSQEVTPAELDAYAGNYRSEELNVTFTAGVRDGSLVLQSSTLHPVFKDGFAGNSMGTVRFLRDTQGRVAGFTVNRNAARGVRFDRLRHDGLRMGS